uniref:Granulins domain-containing protein n=1 Tax=Paramormyrops kingsleyae TaxID=1676925 RepID=A0A3B3R080_9TELE
MLVQTCRKSGSPSSPWQQKKPALKEMPTDLVSGSSESFRHKCGPYSSCPKDTTCCYMNKTSKWGCCPLPKAVCCEDGEHCCPSGYKCNVERTTCSHDTLVIPWYSKMEAQVDQVLHTPVECNMKDGCASGTPCYQLPSGQLRYCPMALSDLEMPVSLTRTGPGCPGALGEILPEPTPPPPPILPINTTT